MAESDKELWFTPLVIHYVTRDANIQWLWLNGNVKPLKKQGGFGLDFIFIFIG